MPQPPDARQRRRSRAWIGSTLYFRSDRNGEFNLFAYDSSARGVKQLTSHDDFPVLERCRPAAARSSTSRPAISTCSIPAAKSARKITHRRAVGFARDAAALREGRQLDPQRGGVADGRARRVRVPRRDPDGAGGKGRRAQPDQQRRRARAVAGVVARRHARRVLLRRVAASTSCTSRRTTARARRRSTGSAAPASTANLAVVARQPEGGLQRQLAVAVSCSISRPATPKQVASAKVYGPVSTISFGWSPDSRWLAYTVNTQPLAMTLSAYSVEQDARSRSATAWPKSASRCSIAAASISTSSGRPTPGRCSTGSRSRPPTTAARATSTWSCCATISRRRWRARATRRSRRPAAAATPGAAGAPTADEDRGGRSRPSRCASISRASNTAFSICRSRPATSPTCRPATPISSTTCAPIRPTRPPAAGRRRRARGCTASISPSGRTSSCSTNVRDYPALGRRARSSSMRRATPGRSRALGAEGQSRRRPAGGRRSRSADRPARRMGADLRRGLADQSRLLLRARTCTASTGRRCARSTARCCRTSPCAAISIASSSGCRASCRSAIIAAAAAIGSRRRGPCPADCSAPTTASRTAAIASRRCTAASTGTRSCARR